MKTQTKDIKQNDTPSFSFMNKNLSHFHPIQHYEVTVSGGQDPTLQHWIQFVAK